ncbi:MAG TPA: tRNA 2-thiouridine(34) synthase MnmA [Candidatus Bathyarchaeia archaeon]|nr:tRNA 2-thiouridine(34) synthase MnmA [Candidatus Bathyarchaeia archaeon]
MSPARQRKKVAVAMSGGVDSSVTAVLLQEKGYQVFGMTMSLTGFLEGQEPKTQPVEDARRICDFLKIPHQVVDVDEIARSCVVDNFVDEYLNGRTPNPCVRCNRFVKFGALFQKAVALGADYFATGHYARICVDRKGFSIRKAKDLSKDQSYFLYGVEASVLPRVLFPLGDMTKQEVRAFAAKRGLPCAQRPESQDICFVPEAGYKDFLKRHVGPEALRPGPFKDPQGNVVGAHQGIGLYTIGQRDKLGIALGHPVYVYRIDPAANTVFVGPKEYLSAKGLVAVGFQNLGLDLSKGTVDVAARIRYNAPDVEAQVARLDGDRIEVKFAQPQNAVTPGQSVVFYDEDRLLGGALIEAPLLD